MQTAAAGVVAATVARGEQAAKNAGVESRQPVDKRPYKTSTRINSVIRREETVLRYGGNGDNWHMSWGADDRQYVSLCDGGGFSDEAKAYYNSRMIAISGSSHNAKFHDVPNYPMLGAPTQEPKSARYYGFGTLALNGFLYQFMSTFNRPMRADELGNRDANDALRFNGVKLIYSPDAGRTWHNQDHSTPVRWEQWHQRSRDTMVFFNEDQEAFSLLTVLQMGKNYEHNRDGYIYVYAPNGNSEGTMNELVMFRAKKGKLLNRREYEYFAGRYGDDRAKWTRDIEARAAVHTFPRGWVNALAHPYAWHPSVVYNAPLGLFMMANWGMGTESGGMWFGKPSYLGFWVARDPWGPWTQIHEETAWLPAGDRNSRAYQPQIAPKWIAPDGKSFWLVWTDFQGVDVAELNQFRVEYRRKWYASVLGEADIMRYAMMMRKHMPYYAFNIQRIDLRVA